MRWGGDDSLRLSLALLYQIIFGNRCSYLLKGFKGSCLGWPALCFSEMTQLLLEGPNLAIFRSLCCLAVLRRVWHERTAALQLRANGQHINPLV